jgi:hypothetical protein
MLLINIMTMKIMIINYYNYYYNLNVFDYYLGHFYLYVYDV